MAKNDKKNYITDDDILQLDDEITEITESNLKEFADQLQFDSLASECVLEDLALSYGISREDMFVLIHELKKRGNNVITMNTTAYVDTVDNDEKTKEITLIRNFGHKKLIDDLSYEIVNNDENIKVMFISDTRFGSIYQQTTILNDMYLKAKSLGVKYVFLTGDIVEGMYKGVKDIYNTTLHKHGFYNQAEHVASLFPRVEGITTYFITGEHDLSFLNSEAVDIGNEIAKRREDMIYLGPRRRKVNFVTEDRKGSVSLYLQHAKGNVPYTVSYKPQQKIASMRNEDKTNILITSHFGACDSFERRGVRSYQVPTVVATTDEMKDATTPVYNTVGSWIVTLNKDKKGNLKNTTQIWLPYYKTIIDDYKIAKQLYLANNKQIYINQTYNRDDKDKVFNSIRNGETLDSALERLNTTELKFGGILEELKLKGYDIDIKEEYGVKIICKKRNRSTNKEVKPDLSSLTKVSELWISDTHLCNEAQQLNMLNKVFEEAYEKGIRRVRHFGDITDGDYQGRPEHRYELFRLGADRQGEYVINYYPKVKGMETIAIGGNHDATHGKNGGANVCKMIEKAREDITYVGDEFALVPLPENSKTIIEMYHPGGGCASSLSYRAQKHIDKMESGTKPNAVGMGHFHQSHFLSYRNVIAILLPCLTAKSAFAIRQGLENTMGAYYINMYINKDGSIEAFEFEEKRFTQQDVKKDDFLKTKQLVLNK